MSTDDDFIVTMEPIPPHMEPMKVLFSSAKREGWKHDLDKIADEVVTMLVENAKKIEDCVGIYRLDLKVTVDREWYAVLAMGMAAKHLPPDESNDFGL